MLQKLPTLIRMHQITLLLCVLRLFTEYEISLSVTPFCYHLSLSPPLLLSLHVIVSSSLSVSPCLPDTLSSQS